MQDPRFEHESYLVRQKVIKLFGGAFHVFDPAGQVVLISAQKAFKLREDVRVFGDESKSEELLTIRARNVIDFAASYDVSDSRSGEKVGALRRKGLKSMVKDEWHLLDPSDVEMGTLHEESTGLALARRFLPLVALFSPQTYHLDVGGQTLVTMKRNMNPFVSKVAVDFSGDPSRRVDRRLGLAAAILLCAIEGKQGN